MTLVIGSDGKKRCKWTQAAPDFEEYHDTEWGFPVSDEIRLFEKICLESFQSGLSWRTILSKRENFRRSFHNFDFHRIAMFDEMDKARLLQDKGIVRHKGKIEAVINNAQKARELQTEFGSVASYFWSFEPDNNHLFEPQTRTTSDESVKLSKDLKKRGWKFVGPTTMFAFMQAMGLINDHSEGCIIREKVNRARAAFEKP